ncbi:AraC family transcriptional regulator [Tabrizicola sp. J26]|uniref:helix-turn-helix transcriptional regulator n=1 Tax=Alitabrizicola rongguiensis TaxID=2909234 RepID=UPI001F4662FE|nr:AraC family transcriptional regulator [Tabrizicola rongguiensis]MCF1707316.1 AraC family transcriptional regulator [Tabrizicola rongguiensis]
MISSRCVAPDLGWSNRVLGPSRSGGGSGFFERIHYFDLSDAESGHAATKILLRNGGSVGFSVVRSTGHEVGLEDGSALTVLFPLRGKVMSATDAFDLTARPGEAMILPPGRRRTVVNRSSEERFEAITLTMPASARRLPSVGARVLRTSEIDDLAKAAATARVIARQADPMILNTLLPAAQNLLEGALAEIASSPAVGGLMRGAQAVLQRAEVLMRERLSEDFTMRSLAEEIGISLRQLQDLFRRQYGRSPHAYLTRLRLEHAHLMLKGAMPVPSVTDIALLSGFNHLGRFPRSYRDRFGNLPSRNRQAGRLQDRSLPRASSSNIPALAH